MILCTKISRKYGTTIFNTMLQDNRLRNFMHVYLRGKITINWVCFFTLILIIQNL